MVFGLLGNAPPAAPTTQGISGSTLAGWYSARASAAVARAAGPQLSGVSTQQAAVSVEVRPPWDVLARSPQSDELKRQALATGDFIDTKDLGGFSDIDAPLDQKQLFALHQGLKKMRAIAEEAADKSTVSGRLSFLDRRFQEGMTQVQNFLSTANFTDLTMIPGEDRNRAEGAARIPRATETFQTGTVWEGQFDAEVPALANAGPFTITATKLNEPPTPITIDLSQMPAGQPKNLDNVATYINDQLSAAGFQSAFKRVKLGEPDEDGIVQGQRFGFEITGISTESLSFAAPGAPSLVLAGVSGGSTAAGAAAGQLTKLTDLGSGAPTQGVSQRIEAIDPASVTTSDDDVEGADLRIVKSVGGPNGSVYALAETQGKTDGAPGPLGDQDVLLQKFDSTGRLLWSRAVGAADTADGLALAVGADGTVAIGGAITGALGASVDAGGKDAFVASYDPDGAQNWINRFGSRGDDAVSALAVDDTGQVYAGGKISGSLTGQTFGGGGADGVVRAFSTTGQTQWTEQIAGAGADGVEALTVAGGALFVGSVESGVASVTKRALADGAADPTFNVNLGALDGGRLSGLAYDASDGALYVAGIGRDGFSADDASLGGGDGFVTRINGLSDDTVGYTRRVGGAGEDAITGIVASGGDVYLSGRSDNGVEGGSAQGARDAFAVKLNGADGAVDWATQFTGRGGLASAEGLAFSASGSSALDAFGLPQGDLVYADSERVVDRTTASAGDYFDIRLGNGVKKRITVDADDSLRSLAIKLDIAMGVAGDASVSRNSEGSALRITPADGVTLELVAGNSGQDLLAGLGMDPGTIIRPDPDDADEGPERYGLELTGGLSASSTEAAERAVEILDDAMTTIRNAYRDLTRDPALDDLLNPDGPGKRGGEVPAYLTARISAYQTALSRLGGG